MFGLGNQHRAILIGNGAVLYFRTIVMQYTCICIYVASYKPTMCRLLGQNVSLHVRLDWNLLVNYNSAQTFKVYKSLHPVNIEILVYLHCYYSITSDDTSIYFQFMLTVIACGLYKLNHRCCMQGFPACKITGTSWQPARRPVSCKLSSLTLFDGHMACHLHRKMAIAVGEPAKFFHENIKVLVFRQR